ncbi:hypothetical protein ABT076_10705 [Streptomyces sp. NPDC002131]|uniref:hypothetical protein n=1 Tax=Streptomyces sp. NPDC002131 TaxID=3154535 RepID=UPI00331CC1FA
MTGWRERLDVIDALEAAGWTSDGVYPLEILRMGEAAFAIADEAGNSVLATGGWAVDFPSDVPVLVVVAACLAAAGQAGERLADVIQLRPEGAQR